LLNPTTLQFGTQEVGTTSTTQALHVVNLGPGALTIGDLSISGPAAGDFILHDTCRGTTIDPDQGCVINVRFTPRAPGTRRATLIMSDNAVHNPQTVSLQGRASCNAPCTVVKL
jgi:hypothetical protein